MVKKIENSSVISLWMKIIDILEGICPAIVILGNLPIDLCEKIT